jgi:hypothetical protein
LIGFLDHIFLNKITFSKMKSQNDSETNSVNIELIKSKMETLRAAMTRFDRNFDDRLDINELQNFLDSNMKNGKKFDRQLAQKIFSLLDLDQDGKLTAEEFIKTYLQLEEEMKTNTKELQLKYLSERDNKERLFKQMAEHRNEKLNSEGIGPDGKVIIEIADIIFLKPGHSLDFNGIIIRMTLGGDAKQTKSLNLATGKNKLVWHESFEL